MKQTSTDQNYQSPTTSRVGSRSRDYQRPSSNSWQVKCHGLSARGTALWKRRLWTDCEFLVGDGGEKLAAHRVVLASASPVFAAMLYGPLSCPDQPVRVPDVPLEIFTMMLKYIYTDDIGNIRTCDIASKLYSAAEYFNLPHLQSVCKAFLLSNVSPYTVLPVYEFAVLFDENEVIEKCLEVMRNQTAVVLSSTDIKKVKPSTIATLLSQNSLAVPNELVLLQLLKNYALAHGYEITNNTLQDVSCQTIDVVAQSSADINTNGEQSTLENKSELEGTSENKGDQEGTTENKSEQERPPEKKKRKVNNNNAVVSIPISLAEVIDLEDDSYSDIDGNVTPNTNEEDVFDPNIDVEEEETEKYENKTPDKDSCEITLRNDIDSGYGTPSVSTRVENEVENEAEARDSNEGADITVDGSNAEADKQVKESEPEIPSREPQRKEVCLDKIDKVQGQQIMRKLVQGIRLLTIPPENFSECDISCLFTESERLAILMNMLSPNSCLPMPTGLCKLKESRTQDRKSFSFETMFNIERKSSYKHFDVRNITWYLKVQNKGKHLKVSIIMIVNKTKKLTCKANMKLKLFSFSPGVGPLVHNAVHVFSRSEEQRGYGWMVMDWDKLINPRNGYVCRNNIRVGVHFSAEMPNIEVEQLSQRSLL